VSLDAAPDDGGAATAPLAFLDATAATPERAALGGERHRAIARLVKALPPKLRDPLLLVGSGDYSYDEVAAVLAIPVGTVKWRVSDARRQLRAKLSRLGF
jgi:RNA polymerase sigma-70 factor (ECF subfamily)